MKNNAKFFYQLIILVCVLSCQNSMSFWFLRKACKNHQKNTRYPLYQYAIPSIVFAAASGWYLNECKKYPVNQNPIVADEVEQPSGFLQGWLIPTLFKLKFAIPNNNNNAKDEK